MGAWVILEACPVFKAFAEFKERSPHPHLWKYLAVLPWLSFSVKSVLSSTDRGINSPWVSIIWPDQYFFFILFRIFVVVVIIYLSCFPFQKQGLQTRISARRDWMSAVRCSSQQHELSHFLKLLCTSKQGQLNLELLWLLQHIKVGAHSQEQAAKRNSVYREAWLQSSLSLQCWFM